MRSCSRAQVSLGFGTEPWAVAVKAQRRMMEAGRRPSPRWRWGLESRPEVRNDQRPGTWHANSFLFCAVVIHSQSWSILHCTGWPLRCISKHHASRTADAAATAKSLCAATCYVLCTPRGPPSRFISICGAVKKGNVTSSDQLRSLSELRRVHVTSAIRVV